MNFDSSKKVVKMHNIRPKLNDHVILVWKKKFLSKFYRYSSPNKESERAIRAWVTKVR